MKRKYKIKNLLSFLLFILIVGCIIFLVIKIVNKNETGKDSNKKEETKKTTKTETAPPEIKLLGREEYTIVKNGVYEEYGATATDDVDGDISSKIKIDSKVKIDKPGDYVVTYSVEDSEGNESKVDRKVTIIDVTEPNTAGVPVLMYHYFYDDENGEIGEDANYLAVSMFKKQLDYLKENNYYFPSMKELALYVDGKLELPKNSVIITMDDGAESNYRLAYPLAVQYKIPMTMFVVTSWTDVSQPLQQEMKNTGYIIFQSHTNDMHQGGCSGMKHGALIQCIDYQTGVADMKKSKELLGNGDSMAYPCGDYNDQAFNILTEAGFTLGFTVDFGKVHKGDNKLALPRVRVSDGNSLDYFIGCL
ncbi:MAG: DUF5011 domain-containing protein [Bacilli bacterium]|nr:DUF5011 domain-containing protein [Bacilli bacterium]